MRWRANVANSVARWVGLKVHKIMLKSSCFKKKVHVHKILLDLERMCQFFLRYVFFFKFIHFLDNSVT